MLLEKRLRDTLERVSLPVPSGGADRDRDQALLQQILSAVRGQGSRLAKLESSCLGGGPGTASSSSSSSSSSASDSKTGAQGLAGDGKAHLEQEVTSPGEGMATLERTLAAVVTELQQTRAELERVTRSTRQRYLPAGETSRPVLSWGATGGPTPLVSCSTLLFLFLSHTTVFPTAL